MGKTENKVETSTFVVEAFKYKTTLNKMFQNRKPYKPADPKEVYSVLPGAIKELHVKEGDKVNLGDDLLVFEAMKMNNTLKAPIEGTIKSIHVKLEEKIMKNQLLLEFE
jgi:biotin carboxyl carrier protein